MKVLRWKTVTDKERAYPYRPKMTKWHIPLWRDENSGVTLCGISRPKHEPEKGCSVYVEVAEREVATCARCRTLLRR